MVIRRLGNDSRLEGAVSRERIVIEGEEGGVRFTIPSYVNYNPYTETVEQGIIRAFGSQASTFEELMVEQGWTKASWSFPSIVDFRERITIV